MSNRDAPERIWAHTDTPMAQCKSGSWHESPYGTKYVRADIHEALQAQVAQMREALEAIPGWPLDHRHALKERLLFCAKNGDPMTLDPSAVDKLWHLMDAAYPDAASKESDT